jgi:hypothetical protein
LNCFLDDPEDIPAAVVDYVAEQLGPQAADLRGTARRRPAGITRSRSAAATATPPSPGEQWCALACWLYKRAWTTGERPIVLFDRATHRLAT